jgi:hypothetical protein
MEYRIDYSRSGNCHYLGAAEDYRVAARQLLKLVQEGRDALRALSNKVIWPQAFLGDRQVDRIWIGHVRSGIVVARINIRTKKIDFLMDETELAAQIAAYDTRQAASQEHVRETWAAYVRYDQSPAGIAERAAQEALWEGWQAERRRRMGHY